jgi:gluconolactonase
VRAGTRVRLIRDLFQSTEAPIAMPDGSLLFAEQDAGDGRLVRIDSAGHISVFVDSTNRTIGLAFDHRGRLIGTQSKLPRVGVLWPTRETLVSEFEGISLVAPNDLVIDRRGGIYFTDPLTSRFRPAPSGRTRPFLFYLRPDGTLLQVSDSVERPNGITLSPDERVLYAANGPTIAAFDVQPDGTLRNFRTFATLKGGIGDSMCVDADGRIYIAADGVEVFDARGSYLGTIPTPMRPQAVAFAGVDRKTLYIVGSGAVWQVSMLAEGIRTRAK